MEEFKISYDENEDILYLAKEGLEHEIVELSPGVNLLNNQLLNNQ
jgi:hypothetical protein